MSFLTKFGKPKSKAGKSPDVIEDEMQPLEFIKRNSPTRSPLSSRLRDRPTTATIAGPATSRSEETEAFKPLLSASGGGFTHGKLSEMGVTWPAFEGMGIDPTSLKGKYLCLWQPEKPDHNGYVILHNQTASFYRELRLAPDPENKGHRTVHIERAGLNAMVFKVFDVEKEEQQLLYLMPKHAFQARVTGTIERPEEFVHYLCERDLRKHLSVEPGNDDGLGRFMIKIVNASSGVLLGEGVDDVSVIGLQLRGMVDMGYIVCGVERTPFDLVMSDIEPLVLPRRKT